MGLTNILVVDDEPSMRHLLSVILVDHGYDVRAVSSAEEALKEIAARDYDLVLTDVRMPGMGGLALVGELQRLAPDLLVIVMSAYGTHDTALEAMKAGAYDYLPKPFKPDDVVLVLRKAEERERLARENRQAAQRAGRGLPAGGAGGPVREHAGGAAPAPAAWRPRRRPCSCGASRAPARSSWPVRSTISRPGPAWPSWP